MTARTATITDGTETRTATIDDTATTITISAPTGGGGGVTDHGDLDGLGDDDHPQYLLAAEAQTLVDAAIAALIDGAPAALNTLNELAAAINDDASFAAAVTTALAGKQPLDDDLTWVAANLSAFARTLLDDADQPAAATTLKIPRRLGAQGPGSSVALVAAATAFTSVLTTAVSITGGTLQAGDEVEGRATILFANTSGSNRAPQIRLDFGGDTLTAEGASVATGNSAIISVRFHLYQVSATQREVTFEASFGTNAATANTTDRTIYARFTADTSSTRTLDIKAANVSGTDTTATVLAFTARRTIA